MDAQDRCSLASPAEYADSRFVQQGLPGPRVFDLYAPNSITFTSNSYDDPVLCPNGVPVAGADPSRDCGQQFRQLQGGSKSVESEESTAWSMGIVFEIMSNVTIGLDYFNYEVEGTIGALPETAIFGDTARYADKFVRCSTLSAADQAAIDACVPGTVDPWPTSRRRRPTSATFVRRAGTLPSARARRLPTTAASRSRSMAPT